MGKLRSRDLKPKKQSGDFKKQKVKVGKTLKKGNETNVKVTSKRIIIPLQANLTLENGKRVVDEINKIVKQMHHFNGSVQVQALHDMKRLLMQFPDMESMMSLVLPNAFEVIYGEEQETRDALLDFSSAIFNAISSESIISIVPILMTYLCGGLTHLHLGIRRDALALLLIVCNKHSLLLSDHAHKLISVIAPLLSDPAVIASHSSNNGNNSAASNSNSTSAGGGSGGGGGGVIGATKGNSSKGKAPRKRGNTLINALSVIRYLISSMSNSSNSNNNSNGSSSNNSSSNALKQKQSYFSVNSSFESFVSADFLSSSQYIKFPSSLMAVSSTAVAASSEGKLMSKISSTDLYSMGTKSELLILLLAKCNSLWKGITLNNSDLGTTVVSGGSGEGGGGNSNSNSNSSSSSSGGAGGNNNSSNSLAVITNSLIPITEIVKSTLLFVLGGDSNNSSSSGGGSSSSNSGFSSLGSAPSAIVAELEQLMGTMCKNFPYKATIIVGRDGGVGNSTYQMLNDLITSLNVSVCDIVCHYYLNNSIFNSSPRRKSSKEHVDIDGIIASSSNYLISEVYNLLSQINNKSIASNSMDILEEREEEDDDENDDDDDDDDEDDEEEKEDVAGVSIKMATGQVINRFKYDSSSGSDQLVISKLFQSLQLLGVAAVNNSRYSASTFVDICECLNKILSDFNSNNNSNSNSNSRITQIAAREQLIKRAISCACVIGSHVTPDSPILSVSSSQASSNSNCIGSDIGSDVSASNGPGPEDVVDTLAGLFQSCIAIVRTVFGEEYSSERRTAATLAVSKSLFGNINICFRSVLQCVLGVAMKFDTSASASISSMLNDLVMFCLSDLASSSGVQGSAGGSSSSSSIMPFRQLDYDSKCAVLSIYHYCDFDDEVQTSKLLISCFAESYYSAKRLQDSSSPSSFSIDASFLFQILNSRRMNFSLPEFMKILFFALNHFNVQYSSSIIAGVQSKSTSSEVNERLRCLFDEFLVVNFEYATSVSSCMKCISSSEKPWKIIGVILPTIDAYINSYYSKYDKSGGGGGGGGVIVAAVAVDYKKSIRRMVQMMTVVEIIADLLLTAISQISYFLIRDSSSRSSGSSGSSGSISTSKSSGLMIEGTSQGIEGDENGDESSDDTIPFDGLLSSADLSSLKRLVTILVDLISNECFIGDEVSSELLFHSSADVTFDSVYKSGASAGGVGKFHYSQSFDLLARLGIDVLASQPINVSMKDLCDAGAGTSSSSSAAEGDSEDVVIDVFDSFWKAFTTRSVSLLTDVSIDESMKFTAFQKAARCFRFFTQHPKLIYSARLAAKVARLTEQVPPPYRTIVSSTFSNL